MQATHLNEVSMEGKYGVQFLRVACGILLDSVLKQNSGWKALQGARLAPKLKGKGCESGLSPSI